MAWTQPVKKRLTLVVENTHQRPYLNVGSERLKVPRSGPFGSRVYLADYLTGPNGERLSAPHLACPCTSIG